MTPSGPLPTGTVTFLFTDIEGSTDLVRSLGPGWREVVEEHNGLVREAIGTAGGAVIRTEGDAFFAAFPTAPAAVAAAVQAQRALAAHRWPQSISVRVRMGLHTGEGVLGGDDYVGLDVHRGARIAASAHGGQVVVSSATRSLIDEALPGGVSLRDLGKHRVRDFARPERLWQLEIPGLPSEFPPPRTLEIPTSLPTYLTGFVGRARELSRVEELMSGARLLTLTGPGGTGKTRLAVEAASRLAERFPDGVFFVDLSSVADPRLVAPTIADALGVEDEAGRPVLELLVERLRDRRTLLLLDNLEQVLDGVEVVGRLIGSAGGLTVLATSRSPLGLSGEQEVPVPPLALPDRSLDPEEQRRAEAVVLFAQRASEVDPEFSLTEEDAPAVAEICARLDGLPLGIELAAARVRVLSPPAMLARLERHLPVLGAGPRDAPARQRTLQATIGWSYDLLDDPERAVFRRLAVFVGGWSAEAAEEVAHPEEGGDLLEVLDRLVRHGLVRRDPADPVRFGMLETIREFGLERLGETGEEDDVRRRHAVWFLGLAEEAEPHLTGPDRRTWLERLDREEDNIRGVLRWAARGEAEIGLRITAALWRFWHLRGHLAEWRGWFDDLLALPSAAARTAVRARALTGLGGIAYWQNDAPAVRSAYEEALAIARERGDERGIAEGTYNLAFAHQMEGPNPRSRALYEESRAMFERLGDRRGAASSLLGMALYAHVDGDPRGGLRRAREAHRILAEAGDRVGEADALDITGAMHLGLEDMDAAGRAFRQALDTHEEAGDLIGVALDLDGLATVAARRGDDGRALRLAGAARAIKDSVGGKAPGPLSELLDPVPHLEGPGRPIQDDPALREGRELTVGEALVYAREGEER